MTTILIVDDRPINREVLSMLVEGAGYQTIEAENGAHALEIMRNIIPELIITDIVMPKMDGLSLVKELYSRPHLATIPVIFYSATHKAAEAYKLANDNKVKYVLNKPSAPHVILSTIEAALTQHSPSVVPSLTSTNKDIDIPKGNLSRGVLEEKIDRLEIINLRLTNLIEIGLDMSLEHNIEQLMYIVAKGGRQFLDACYAGVMIQDPTNKRVYNTLVMDRDNHSTVTQLKLSNPQGLLQQVFSGEAPICAHFPIVDLEMLGLFDFSLPINSFLTIPLKTPRKYYGLFYFIHKFSEKTFDTSDQRFMMTLADKFAIHYENLILYQEIERHRNRLKEEITQRTQTESAFLQSEKNFRQLAENIQEVFWITAPDFKKFIYVSPIYEKIWGRFIKDLYDNPYEWIESIVPDERQRVLDSFLKFDGEKQIDIEYRIIRSDGSLRWIHNRGFQVLDEAGTLYRIAGIAADITERKKLEELAFHHKYHLELAEMSRVNSMGEMASTLAHELNQPLTAILTYTQTCVRALQHKKVSNKEVLQAMQKVAQQAERAGVVIHRMKDFIRKGNLILEFLNINEILLKLEPLILYEGRNTATVFNFDLAKGLSEVYFDKIQIEQVILNLVRNAIEAMQEADTINPRLIIQTRGEQDNVLRISVCDNGPGFPKSMVSTLFSPYVTTKAMGTGMGLAISRTIIEAHGGQLAASTEEMKTCFSFTLPILNPSKEIMNE